jgi:hypothetical protein
MHTNITQVFAEKKTQRRINSSSGKSRQRKRGTSFYLIKNELELMRFPVFIVLSVIVTSVYSQRAQRVMIGAQADLIKSDNDGFFEKMQGGFEGNYYFSRKFSASAGVEWWTEDNVLLVLGGRFCPIDEAFVRVRGFIGKDLSVGGGFAKPLSNRVRIEAIADFYFQGYIAIRGGMAFGFGGNP